MKEVLQYAASFNVVKRFPIQILAVLLPFWLRFIVIFLISSRLMPREYHKIAFGRLFPCLSKSNMQLCPSWISASTVTLKFDRVTWNNRMKFDNKIFDIAGCLHLGSNWSERQFFPGFSGLYIWQFFLWNICTEESCLFVPVGFTI